MVDQIEIKLRDLREERSTFIKTSSNATVRELVNNIRLSKNIVGGADYLCLNFRDIVLGTAEHLDKRFGEFGIKNGDTLYFASINSKDELQGMYPHMGSMVKIVENEDVIVALEFTGKSNHPWIELRTLRYVISKNKSEKLESLLFDIESSTMAFIKCVLLYSSFPLLYGSHRLRHLRTGNMNDIDNIELNAMFKPDFESNFYYIPSYCYIKSIKFGNKVLTDGENISKTFKALGIKNGSKLTVELTDGFYYSGNTKALIVNDRFYTMMIKNEKRIRENQDNIKENEYIKKNKQNDQSVNALTAKNKDYLQIHGKLCFFVVGVLLLAVSLIVFLVNPELLTLVTSFSFFGGACLAIGFLWNKLKSWFVVPNPEGISVGHTTGENQDDPNKITDLIDPNNNLLLKKGILNKNEQEQADP